MFQNTILRTGEALRKLFGSTRFLVEIFQGSFFLKIFLQYPYFSCVRHCNDYEVWSELVSLGLINDRGGIGWSSPPLYWAYCNQYNALHYFVLLFISTDQSWKIKHNYRGIILVQIFSVSFKIFSVSVEIFSDPDRRDVRFAAATAAELLPASSGEAETQDWTQSALSNPEVLHNYLLPITYFLMPDTFRYSGDFDLLTRTTARQSSTADRFTMIGGYAIKTQWKKPKAHYKGVFLAFPCVFMA